MKSVAYQRFPSLLDADSRNAILKMLHGASPFPEVAIVLHYAGPKPTIFHKFEGNDL